ncbi:hypothetical protein DdX_13942 [Ditylenchus destructor]|uniref:Uncharacterized protein n=1 Tax=Ditylenchus destructor TaxID=166010 RepID=A0AAD4R2B8_9BILA|nr:hypothetical protein DdX_13942 [Ditylenchus destructor]
MLATLVLIYAIIAWCSYKLRKTFKMASQFISRKTVHDLNGQIIVALVVQAILPLGMMFVVVAYMGYAQISKAPQSSSAITLVAILFHWVPLDFVPYKASGNIYVHSASQTIQMDTFNTYNAYTCLVMGLSSNLTLAWLILKATKVEMKHYSTILLHSIVVNIAYLVVSAIVQPVLLLILITKSLIRIHL